MARNTSDASDNVVDEEYIDTEESSSSTFFTPLYHREFEFPAAAGGCFLDKEGSTSSPADKLFYKGNLLPLHLPPRLQMVKMLIQRQEEEDYSMEDISATSTSFNTPFDSCNLSRSESCRVSRELSPDEHFFECSEGEEVNRLINQAKEQKEAQVWPKRRSWSKKLKLIKKSSLGNKLKASGAYLKSLFSKSSCSMDDNCGIHQITSIQKSKVVKKPPFGQIQRHRYQGAGGSDREKMIEDSGGHRRSFSGIATKSSSSLSSYNSSSSSSFSSSFNSDDLYELHLLKRRSSSSSSSSANSSGIEGIQGAIAHCKNSWSQQQRFYTMDATSQAELCLMSTLSIAAACDVVLQERSGRLAL